MRDLLIWGSAIERMIRMMAITIRSSISVKPRWNLRRWRKRNSIRLTSYDVPFDHSVDWHASNKSLNALTLLKPQRHFGTVAMIVRERDLIPLAPTGLLIQNGVFTRPRQQPSLPVQLYGFQCHPPVNPGDP